MTERKLVTIDELSEILSLTPSTIATLVVRGKLPGPIEFSQKVKRWDLQEIWEVADRLIAEKNSEFKTIPED